MCARKYDRQLGIRTVGLREWDGQNHYNRYEATPYEALDKLFQSYKFRRADRVVDLGCGRGRVTFYIHNKFQVPVVGVEAHDQTYEEALDNKSSYRMRAKHIQAPIRLKYGLAEHYQVKLDDNCFYLFNPFSVHVFEKVMANVMKSMEAKPRVIDMILYYPLPEYKKVLNRHYFQMINKIKVPSAQDSLEKFLVYRLSPAKDESA